MFGRFAQSSMRSSLTRGFAEEIKAKMTLTLRSPYKTYLAGYEGFNKIVSKTEEGQLIIQSKMPPAAYVLLPGALKVYFAEERKDLTGDFVHAGGFAVIHPNNSCEINLIECFDKNEVQFNKVAEAEISEGGESGAGKYVEKIRRDAKRNFMRLG